MKKITISIGAVLLVLILAVAIYFLFIKDKPAEVDNPNVTTAPTATPVPTEAPTITPDPDETQTGLNLYLATQRIGEATKYGYIDNTGNFVIKPAYDYAYDFSDGLAVVMSGEKYMVIDPSGAVIFENNSVIRPFHNGFAAFSQIKEAASSFGYINTLGEVVIEPQFLYADDFNQDGQAYVVLTDGKTFERVDTAGKIVETYILDLGNSFVNGIEDGYVLYYDQNAMKNGVTTVNGETVLKPEYAEITYIGNDLFAVKNLQPFEAPLVPAALYNAKGEQLTDYSLYDIQHFNGDYTSAADETSVFFIDKTGQVVSSLPSYDGVGKITLLNDIVKTEIDGDLAYYRLDNTLLWKNDNSTDFENGITVKQMKFNPLRNVSVHYPQVEGLPDENVQRKINEDLETYFTEARANITKEDFITVQDDYTAQLKKNLLMITMTGYDYTGGAHGMPLRVDYLIDTTNGNFYELKDLFKKDSDYKTKINEIIQAAIDDNMAAGGGMYVEDAFKGISDAQNFYLDGDNLVIFFYPYDIAPYAAGFPEFKIPFADLTEFINTDGGFWKAFN